MILHPIIDLLKRIVIALPDYAGGVSIDNGLEYTILNDVIQKVKYIGNTIPSSGFKYFWYDYPHGIIVDLSNVITIKDGCFYGCNRIIIDFTTCNNIEVIGNNSFAFGTSNYSDMSAQTAIFPKLTGIGCGEQIFRGINQYWPAVWSFPVMTNIPKFFFSNSTKTNLSIEFGKIGTLVNSQERPFGSSTATGNITVYTNGSELDTVKNIIQNQAGSDLHFIYKAAETTEYEGITYQAGDTILTV